MVIPYRGSEYDYNHLKVMGDLGQLIFRVSVNVVRCMCIDVCVCSVITV